jgi:SP family facilitated glucose transporter-like MFS transporter 1
MGVANILNPEGHNTLLTVLSIVFLMLFIIFFEFSLGPLLWIYMSEIMTEKGLSIGVALNWIAAVNVALFTPILIDVFG